MNPINEEFLGEVGLNDLPSTARDAFDEHVASILHTKVGADLFDRCDEDTLRDFELIQEGNAETVCRWLDEHRQGWRQIEGALDDHLPSASAILWAQEEWLNSSIPEYRKIIEGRLKETEQILRRSSHAILDHYVALDRILTGAVVQVVASTYDDVWERGVDSEVHYHFS